ncbi:MAG: hypothetical protein ACK4SY_06540 [Pyrobaculum sp.]
MNIGKLGECIAIETLRRRGYLVWMPEEFIRHLELAAIYYTIDGKCGEGPKEPLSFSIATPFGYISLTLWRDSCIEDAGRKATPLEYIYLPCVKRCIEKKLGPLLPTLGLAAELLSHRSLLKSIDLFAYKDGVLYAVEVKTNSGRPSDVQIEKTTVLKKVRHLLVRVYLQNPLVEIKSL